MPIDPDDQRSSYVQIADDLRQQIARGELAPGQRLPSTAKLAQAYEVAPMTIRSSLRILNSEGLLVSRQGSGVFVRTTAKVEPDAPELELREVVRQVSEMAHDLQDLTQKVNELETLIRKNTAAPE